MTMTTFDRSESPEPNPRDDASSSPDPEAHASATPASTPVSASEAVPSSPPRVGDSVAPAEPPPSVADGRWCSLSHDFMKVQRITGIFTLLLVFPPLMFVPFLIGFIKGLPWLAYSIPLGIGAIAVFSLWWTWVYASLHHKHARYRVDARQIEWQHGVWWRKVTIVPRTRVQHTDVSQGPLERRFGLGTLHIYTAGTENAKVSISGLEHEKAARIRDHLVQTGLGDAV